MSKSGICFFDSYAIWGGGEKWHFSTAQRACQLGHSVFLVTSPGSEIAKRCQKDCPEIKIFEFPITKRSYYNPLFILKLRRFLKENKIETIVFNSFVDLRNGSFAASLAGLKNIILRCGMPIAPPIKWSYKIAFSYVTRIVAISEEVKSVLHSGSGNLVKNIPFDIIYNGSDFDYYAKQNPTPRFRPQEDCIILGNPSRLSEQKGIPHLLACCRELKDQKVPFKMLIAGIGELEKEMKDLCHQLDLDNEVIFLGFVDKIWDFMASIDMVVFTSLWEGSSHTLVESMAYAKPIVCFNRSTMPEMVKDGYNGFLINELDGKIMAQKVKELIQDKNKRELFSKNSLEMAKTKFDYNKNIQRFFEIIGD